MSEERQFGRVRMYDNFKGFGFIRRDKGKDVFFFYDDVEDDDKNLLEGDAVSFTVEDAPRGPKALQVQKES